MEISIEIKELILEVIYELFLPHLRDVGVL